MKDENGKEEAEQQPQRGKGRKNISNFPGLSIDPYFPSVMFDPKKMLIYYVEVHVHDP